MKNKVLAQQGTLQMTEDRAQTLPDSLALAGLVVTVCASCAYGIDEEERPHTRWELHDAA
jgi:hypothetical protein